MSEQTPDDIVQLQQPPESQQQTADELAFPDLKPGEAWGESITQRRADELETILQNWDAEQEHGDRKGPFDKVTLNGADVFWLAARALAGRNDKQAIVAQTGSLSSNSGVDLSDLHLEGARLDFIHLEGATLTIAHLDTASLFGAHLNAAHLDLAHLEGGRLSLAHLEGASLIMTHLEGARFGEAHLNAANLQAAHLDSANLHGAHLDSANLSGAHLTAANLHGAHLDSANLYGAHLERAVLATAHLDAANLSEAHLEGASLRFAFLDRATSLYNAVLGDEELGHVSIVDARWGDVNLAVVDWTRTVRGFLRLRRRIEAIELGDEREARNPKNSWDDKPKDKARRLQDYKDAVRANRQFATALRQQGLNEDADRFTYRAQTLQREVLRRQGNYGGYAFSLLLWALSGYGYRLWRIAAAYGVVLLTFAVIFLALGVHSHTGEPGIQALWDSFLVSLSAIHGRTVFEQLGAWTPAAWAAAVESVVGIIIEGVFVAMLIQRFFAR